MSGGVPIYFVTSVYGYVSSITQAFYIPLLQEHMYYSSTDCLLGEETRLLAGLNILLVLTVLQDIGSSFDSSCLEGHFDRCYSRFERSDLFRKNGEIHPVFSALNPSTKHHTWTPIQPRYHLIIEVRNLPYSLYNSVGQSLEQTTCCRCRTY